MIGELDLPYSPKRSTMGAVAAAFAVGAAFLGYVALTEDWTPSSSGMLRIATAASVLSFLMCAVFGAILLRSKSWRIRVDAQGVSVDTLAGRRNVEWTDLRSVEKIGEGRTRALTITGTKSSFGISAMLMSDPSQLERVFEVLQLRLRQGRPPP